MKFLAVIILYNQNVGDCITLNSLNIAAKKINICIDIIVYDNSEFEETYQWLFENLSLIKYKRDSNNSGVSVGYNFALNIANLSGYKYLLLLDQDTDFSLNFIEEAVEAIIKYPDINIFSPVLTFNNIIYSPCKYFLYRGWHFKNMSKGIKKIKHVNLLNSGLIINVKLLNNINGFNPKLKLYFSDFDFINRCKKFITQYYCLGTICYHQLGSADKSNFEKTVVRFRYYSEGAKIISQKKPLSNIVYGAMLLLRALKLSIHFKAIIFFKIYYNEFLANEIK